MYWNKIKFNVAAILLVVFLLTAIFNVGLYYINAEALPGEEDDNPTVEETLSPTPEESTEPPVTDTPIPTEPETPTPTEEETPEPTPTPTEQPQTKEPVATTPEKTEPPKTTKPAETTAKPKPTPTKVEFTPKPTDKPKPSEVPTVPNVSPGPTEETPNEVEEVKPGQAHTINEGMRNYVIRIAGWWDESKNNKKIQNIVKEFEKKYNCQVLFMDLSKQEIFNQLLISKATGKAFADAVFVETYDVLPKMVAHGLLAPINLYYTQEELDSIPKSYLSLMSKGGNLYAVPAKAPNFAGLWANIDYLESYRMPNINELYKNGDWTWQKFNEILHNTTLDTNDNGYLDKYGIAVGVDLYPGLMVGAGGSIISWNGKTFQPTINNTRAVSSLNFVRDIYANNYVGDNNEKAFFRIYSGLMTGESWMITNLKKYLDTNLMFTPYPIANQGEPYRALATSAISIGLVESGNYKKETAILIKELYSASRFEEEKNEYLKDFNDISKNVYENMLSNFTVDFSKGFYDDLSLRNSLVRDILNDNLTDERINSYTDAITKKINNRQKTVNLNRLPVNIEW